MHLKVFLKLKKTLKTISSGQIYKKKQKKNLKTPLGWFFFFKRVFSNPGYRPLKFEFKAPPSRPRGPLEALLTPEPNVQQISPAAADKDQNRFREPLKPPPKIKGSRNFLAFIPFGIN